MDFRVGLGFDSHEFEVGKPLFLGGIEIDYHSGLRGHSDGDVIIHAIVDALLGATGKGDIGMLFSDDGSEWKNARSTLFLEKVMDVVRGEGFYVVNLDCVVIADEPKIQPHRESIICSLSELLGVPAKRISVKGKRKEGISCVEGIACICSVLLGRS